MAELIQSSTAPQKRKTRKSLSARPDMTPMVDLAFLLVTFFVLTTSMMKPRAMEIFYPTEDGQPLKANHVLSVLLDEEKDRIFWYYGEFKGDETDIRQTDFSAEGIRKVLLEHNRSVNDRVSELDMKFPPRSSWSETDSRQYARLVGEIYASDHALTVLIKTLPKTPFRNVISAMDELNICHVQKRAVQDMNNGESEFIKGL